ncbi:MAG: hypothetical protein ACRDV0_05490 [Acidimicrobiales bacterium]
MSLRSAGWSVRPSFVPHGPTTGVTLLADEHALTQLAGIPDVAWQTPWEALTNLELVRFSRSMALFATAGGVRYCWRHASLDDYEAWREVVVVHGGSIARRPRRAGVVVVVAVVLVASLAGGVAALFSATSGANPEVAAARAVNLTSNDLGPDFATTSSSLLAALFPPPGQVVPSSTTPTTEPAASSTWGKISAGFEGCVGVSQARDRVFGAAGQMPDYQVTSPIFTSNDFGGIDVASTTQYYATTTMVRHDLAEMSGSRFGSCFSSVNAAMVLTYVTGHVPHVAPGATWRPVTFIPGWARGGEVSVAIPQYPKDDLVVVVIAGGHFEVTLTALTAQWPQSEHFLAGLVNTIKARISSPSSTSA